MKSSHENSINLNTFETEAENSYLGDRHYKSIFERINLIVDGIKTAEDIDDSFPDVVADDLRDIASDIHATVSAIEEKIDESKYECAIGHLEEKQDELNEVLEYLEDAIEELDNIDIDEIREAVDSEHRCSEASADIFQRKLRDRVEELVHLPW